MRPFPDEPYPTPTREELTALAASCSGDRAVRNAALCNCGSALQRDCSGPHGYGCQYASHKALEHLGKFAVQLLAEADHAAKERADG